MGFEEIISTYGKKAGEAVYLYAGGSALQTGDFEKAIKYFKKYAGEDKILLSRAQAGIGDAYVGLEDYKSALAAYEKAAATVDNMFAAGYLLKEGSALEALGQKAEALACYKTVENDYPQSIEAYDIAKYIARVSE
jgi:tetratricopeptide (TPR) repeat protein